MDVLIKSRQMIEKEGTGVTDRPHVVISIASPGSGPANVLLNERTVDVLWIEFHDVDRDHKMIDEGINLESMKKEHAQEIKAFLDKLQGQFEVVVCQCEAGVSRSAGAACAIKVYYDGRGSDKEIRNDDQYAPNKHVRKRLARALLGIDHA